MMKNPNSARPRPQTFSVKTIRFASLVMVGVAIAVLGAMAYLAEREIVGSRGRTIHTYQVRSRLHDLQLEIMRTHAK